MHACDDCLWPLLYILYHVHQNFLFAGEGPSTAVTTCASARDSQSTGVSGQ